MRKAIFILFLVSSIASSISYAEWLQDVTLCLNVSSTADIPFFASFTSSDVFDRWKEAHRINGQSCVGHVYSHGPKSIKTEILAKDHFCKIIFKPDSSCSFLNKVNDDWYRSEYMTTGRHHQFWTFNLTQIPAKEGEKAHVFNLSCQHWATDE